MSTIGTELRHRNKYNRAKVATMNNSVSSLSAFYSLSDECGLELGGAWRSMPYARECISSINFVKKKSGKKLNNKAKQSYMNTDI